MNRSIDARLEYAADFALPTTSRHHADRIVAMAAAALSATKNRCETAAGGKKDVQSSPILHLDSDEEEELGAFIYKSSITARTREGEMIPQENTAVLDQPVDISRNSVENNSEYTYESCHRDIMEVNESVFARTGKRDHIWDAQFAALQSYKNEHGQYSVPLRSSDYPKLGLWVKGQRKLYKAGKMTDDRMKRLDSIGFAVADRHRSWDEQFAALQHYKNEHGHCLVPQSYSENPKLGQWVMQQRANAKVGKVTADRMKRLHSIGFVFDVQGYKWDEQFAALQRYKSEHGHCLVPQRSSDHPKLGRWVNDQRKLSKAGIMYSDRTKRLEIIGFVFDAQNC
ncbi:hypothetical protein ACHAXR_009896 [Thalassiosira sp. AJA248-18]